MKTGASVGGGPENLSVRVRPIVTAGQAKKAETVNLQLAVR